MAKYIDADKLLAEAKELSGPQTGDGWDNWGVYSLIERQPAADVRENARGEWRSIIAKNTVLVETDGYVRRAVECSVCGQYLVGSGVYAVYGRFCPCCGARMRGDNNG